MEALELGNGDEDDNGLSAVTNLDLKESWCQRMIRRPVPTASSIDQAVGLICVCPWPPLVRLEPFSFCSLDLTFFFLHILR